MPQFRSTYNILTKYDEDEVHDSNWFDSDKMILPPKTNWDYGREMQIEDVDIWEIINEQSDGVGVYAAWAPYAEFYMLTTGNDYKNETRYVRGTPYYHRQIETFYGPGAQKKLYRRCKELGINLSVYNTYVEKEDMWLHEEKTQPKTIILPK